MVPLNDSVTACWDTAQRCSCGDCPDAPQCTPVSVDSSMHCEDETVHPKGQFHRVVGNAPTGAAAKATGECGLQGIGTAVFALQRSYAAGGVADRAGGPVLGLRDPQRWSSTQRQMLIVQSQPARCGYVKRSVMCAQVAASCLARHWRRQRAVTCWAHCCCRIRNLVGAAADSTCVLLLRTSCSWTFAASDCHCRGDEGTGFCQTQEQAVVAPLVLPSACTASRRGQQPWPRPGCASASVPTSSAR